MWKVNGRLTTDTKWWQKLTWQGELKKRQKRILFSKCSMFQNAFIGNVISNMYVGRDALVCQQCSENLSLEFTIRLPYKVIDIYLSIFFLVKTMLEILIHYLFHIISSTNAWPLSALDFVSIWKRSCINLYVSFQQNGFWWLSKQ
jgi:hypothetical protein